jgi:hypothetical protein
VCAEFNVADVESTVCDLTSLNNAKGVVVLSVRPLKVTLKVFVAGTPKPL